MAGTQHWTVIGIFDDQMKARQAIESLENVGFTSKQLGFVARNHGKTETGGVSSGEAVEGSGEGTGVVTGGIIGGVLGAANAVLMPIMGPTDASTIPIAGMPLAEEMVNRISHKADVPGLEEPGVTSPGERSIMVEPPIETSIQAPGSERVEDAMQSPGVNAGEAREMEEEGVEEHKRGVDVGEGAIAGGVVGGLLGAATALLIPVIGPVVAGGIVATVLGGAALGAAAGGFLGAFVHMGVPEEHAQRYENEVKAGRTIVTVRTDDRQQDALDILYKNGASYADAHENVEVGQ